MTMHSNRNASYLALVHRATIAADKAATMMNDGSREYESIRSLVSQYCDFHYAADIVSGQTDTGLGDLSGMVDVDLDAKLPAAALVVAIEPLLNKSDSGE